MQHATGWRKERRLRPVALKYNAVDTVTGKSAGPLPLRRPSIIAYDGLPLASGGAHTLRTRSPLAALAQVRNFMSSRTDCVQPQKAWIEVVDGAGATPAAWVRGVIARKKATAETLCRGDSLLDALFSALLRPWFFGR
jgi:hypothetical protein